MNSYRIFEITLLAFTTTLFLNQSHAKITRLQLINEVQGNLLNNNDAIYSATSCCIVPTCKNAYQCYQTLSCGYMCSSGKYPPVEYSPTPGYRMKQTYSKYDCRFGDCRDYEFTCQHCQDPREESFSIYLVRKDCKECYFLE